MVVHLGQTVVGVSVGRVSVHLDAGFPELCRERVRDCPWASADAEVQQDAHQAPQLRDAHRVRRDAQPKVEFRVPARVAAAVQVVAPKPEAQCSVLQQGHQRRVQAGE
jgi:hypothetical protein